MITGTAGSQYNQLRLAPSIPLIHYSYRMAGFLYGLYFRKLACVQKLNPNANLKYKIIY